MAVVIAELAQRVLDDYRRKTRSTQSRTITYKFRGSPTPSSLGHACNVPFMHVRRPAAGDPPVWREQPSPKIGSDLPSSHTPRKPLC